LSRISLAVQRQEPTGEDSHADHARKKEKEGTDHPAEFADLTHKLPFPQWPCHAASILTFPC
jgi:hypothetical protein